MGGYSFPFLGYAIWKHLCVFRFRLNAFLVAYFTYLMYMFIVQQYLT